jgi:antitoxin ParD1/3/4
MATMTISLPDPMKEWVETRIREGEYASSSDYVRDLIRRDRERCNQPELSLEELRHIISNARRGGNSQRSVDDVLEVARVRVRGRGSLND